MSEIKRHKIKNYELWPCIIFDNIISSISESHKMIVRDAKEKGVKETFIAEDDFWLPADDGLKYFFDNKPDKYHIYSGGNYISFGRPERHGLMKVQTIIGLHFYMIHESYYDTFLATDPTKHIDGEQKSDQMYVIYPFAALQRAGFSANNRDNVNYNIILQPEDVRGVFR